VDKLVVCERAVRLDSRQVVNDALDSYVGGMTLVLVACPARGESERRNIGWVTPT